MSLIEREFQEIDNRRAWPIVYQKIKNEASIKSIQDEYSVGEARKPENRSKNRYRDVSPYDHSRVSLQKGDSDYINASLIDVPQCGRKYILSQGPLEHTTGQFWQMIWEQGTRAIIMLNRVMEKGTVKCHQYWPLGEDLGAADEMIFEDAGLKVTLLEEENFEDYIIRTINVENKETEEHREVLHFHYITWPDFGVPSSPDSFLRFLMTVREAGVLESDVGPAVIHCSAGIGRSGTFCLVDSSLILIEKHNSMDSVDVKELLLNMRSFRMGLIQTPDQLRFSYLAIIKGGRNIVPEENNSDLDVQNIIESYMDMSGAHNASDSPPTPPKRTSSLQPAPPRHGPPPPPLPRRTGDKPPEQVEEHVEKTEAESDNDEDYENIPPKLPKLESHKKYEQVADSDKSLFKGDFSRTAEVNSNTDFVSKQQLDEPSETVDQERRERRMAGGGHEGLDAPVWAGHAASAPEQQQYAATGNSVTGSLSENELRRRRRDERKKTTQELIQKMREKQRQSELTKKQPFYLHPVAIGLTIILGGILLYKMYW